MIKFRIFKNLRFLSHAEMVRFFQRACARAGINFRYSQGFNPHPKLSLPLPKTVGVESDEDLLYLKLDSGTDESQTTNYESHIKSGLSRQLADGCELLEVRITSKKVSLRAVSATYIFPLQPEQLNEHLRNRITRLLESENLQLKRRIDARGNTRNVDVRDFVSSIEIDDKEVVVECKITSAGTIRVDEILGLLELDTDKLAAHIRRSKIDWNISHS